MPAQNNPPVSTGQLIVIFAFIIILIGGGCWGCPAYRVYNARMTGEAEYQRAEKNRQIQVVQSQAKMEAAVYELRSDTTRAWGIARSNQIIGQSLSPEYLRWLYIDQLSKTNNQIIYLPTEAGLPILEANRFNRDHQYNQQAGTTSAP